MNVHQFISSSQERWKGLERFISQASRLTLARVPLEDFQVGSLLYRQTLADLGHARSRYPTHKVVRELEQLVGRAHSVIYQARPVKRSEWRKFWTHDWPRIAVQSAGYIFTAVAIFGVSSVIGFIGAIEHPFLETFFISRQMRAAMNSGHLWTESLTSIAPQGGSAIITNNITVSILAWALGATFGIGTIWLLIMNGLMLGVISAACLRAGLFAPLAEFIVAHGSLEIPAICIAAGAGLMMAEAMVSPGRYSRTVELRQAGARSARLLFGVVPMLLVAGVVEAFVSPSDLSPVLKVGLAVSLFAAYAMYVLGGMRWSATELAGGDPRS